MANESQIKLIMDKLGASYEDAYRLNGLALETIMDILTRAPSELSNEDKAKALDIGKTLLGVKKVYI